MSNNKTRGTSAAHIIAGLTVGATVLAVPAAGLAAQAAPQDAPDLAVAEGEAPANVLAVSSAVKAPAIGTFSYDQTFVSPVSDVARLSGASQVLCGGVEAVTRARAADWQIKISGDVDNEIVATVGELVAEKPANQLMTCSCGGNPAGGRAIATAQVTGIPIEQLLTVSQAQAGVNVVTFIGADGTQVSMPLAYAIGRHAVIGCEINDADIADSVGCANQLWLAKTPANYFVRDIVEVVFSASDQLPANPGEGVEHPNSPNAGILTGVQA